MVALPAPTFELSDVPSLLQLEDCVRSLPLRKAPGPSQMPNEVWRDCPVASARDWMPVFLKAHKRLTEPFRFSVGLLFALYKQKGPQHCLQSFRSIFLLEGLGKGFRKLLRHCLIDDLRRQAPDLFAGCLPGSLTGALTHYLCTALSMAAGTGRTCGILFLDAHSAYYRVLRSRLTGEQLSDADLCSILDVMGVAPDLVHAILAWAAGPPLFSSLNAHQQQFLSSLFRAPAFLLKGQAWMHSTRSGTRPGDSIADVLFAAVMVDGLNAIHARLESEDLHMLVPQCRVASPTWADDVSLPFCAERPDMFVAKATATCRIVHEELGRRALQLNYSPDKSALLIAWHGHGCRKEQQRLERLQTGIAFTAFGAEVRVPVVTSYTQLGSRLCSTYGALPDLRRKVQMAKANARPLAKHVLRRQDISLDRRRRILSSIALSVSHYNVGIWGALTAEAQRTWIQSHSDVLRFLLRDDRWQGDPVCPSVYEVCGAVGLAFPIASLTRERIWHACRVVTGCYTALWELLCVEDTICSASWLSVLRSDLRWVGQWAPGLCRSTDFSSLSGAELAVWLSEHHRVLRRELKQAVSAQTASLQEWHAFQLACRKEGIFKGVSWTKATSGSQQQMACPLCKQLFTNGSHLMTHAAQAHGHVCPSRRYAPGSRCPHCLKQHWTVERLHRHLSSGPECLAALVCTRPPLSDLELAEVDERHRSEVRASKSSGRSCHGDHAPVLRLCGPRLPVPAHADAELAHALCEASPFDLISLQRSAATLASNCFPDLLGLAESQHVLSAPRAAISFLPSNPDGRLWIRQAGTGSG